MRIFENIKPEWPIRLGLGAMFVYSGYDLIMHPTSWLWALRPLPQFVQVFINNQIGAATYLQFQGGAELLLGLILIAWFLPRWLIKLAAVVATLEMAVILVFVGVDPITFRDFGVLGGAFALLILLFKDNTYSLRGYGGK